MDLVRNPTTQETQGDPNSETSGAFEPILLPGGVVPKTPQMLFEKKLGEEGRKATLDGLPFAEGAVRAEYQDKLEAWKRTFRRQGYADKKRPTFDDIEWKKYSDIKNFELVEESQTRDRELSKDFHRSIFIKYKKYRYKGFSNTYTVMEDPDTAVDRQTASRTVAPVVTTDKTSEKDKK